MARGKPLTIEQIETAKAAYASTRSYRAAGVAAGCSANAAKDHVLADDGFEQVRALKRVDIIEKIAELQIKLIETMMDPVHLAKASFQELGNTFGIAVEKRLLLTGQATQRIETGGIDPGKLTPEEREAAARIRAKLAGETVPV